MKKKHWLNPLSLEDWEQLSPREYIAQMEILDTREHFKILKSFVLEHGKEDEMQARKDFLERINFILALLKLSIDSMTQSYSLLVSEEAEKERKEVNKMKKKHWFDFILNPLWSPEDYIQLSAMEHIAEMEIQSVREDFKRLKDFVLEHKRQDTKDFEKMLNYRLDFLQGSIDNVIQSYSFVVSEEAETKKQGSGSKT